MELKGVVLWTLSWYNRKNNKVGFNPFLVSIGQSCLEKVEGKVSRQENKKLPHDKDPNDYKLSRIMLLIYKKERKSKLTSRNKRCDTSKTGVSKNCREI